MAKKADEAETAAQAQAEAKRQADAEKQREKAKKQEQKDAVTGYSKLLERVRDLKALTDQPMWRQLFANARKIRRDHHNAMLTEETPKAIVKHQQAALFVDEFLALAAKPVEELQAYCQNMPLFTAQFKTRAEWNDELGIVRLLEQ